MSSVLLNVKLALRKVYNHGKPWQNSTMYHLRSLIMTTPFMLLTLESPSDTFTPSGSTLTNSIFSQHHVLMCLYRFRTNSDYFFIQHYLTCIYNRDRVFTARYALGIFLKQTTFRPWRVNNAWDGCRTCSIKYGYSKWQDDKVTWRLYTKWLNIWCSKWLQTKSYR